MLEKFHSKVVGVSHRNPDGSSRQKIIKSCRVGEELRFDTEPENIHDPNAIAVKRQNGQQLGYLGARLAADINKKAAKGWGYKVIISDITGGEKGKPTRGVNLLIAGADPETAASLNAKKTKRSGCAFGLIAAVLIAASIGGIARGFSSPTVAPPTIQVYFSPHGGCESAVIREIRAARHTLDIEAYTFTSTPIAQAVGEAEARGVRVRALLDKKAAGEHYSAGTYLTHHGVDVRLDGHYAIAHSKVMVIDGAEVITGSFKFTRTAEQSNAENLLVIHDAELAGKYEANFEGRWAACE